MDVDDASDDVDDTGKREFDRECGRESPYQVIALAGYVILSPGKCTLS